MLLVRLLAAAAVATLQLIGCAEAQIGGSGTTVAFALTLRVPKDSWDATYEETKMLWEYAKEKQVGSNVELFMRAAFTKVNESMAAVMEKRAQDKAAAAKKASEPRTLVFTEKYAVKDGEVMGMEVRPLKSSAAAPRSNVRTYTPEQLAAKMAAKQLNLEEPFLVKGGVSRLRELQEKWTAEYLVQNVTEHRLQYFTPADAKAKRSFDTKAEQEKAEQEKYKPHLISFEKYFKNCFNHRAKPDFKKFGGVGTEHCEQFVSVADVDAPMAAEYVVEPVAPLGWMRELQTARTKFLDGVLGTKEGAALLPEGVERKQLQGESSRLLAMGPSGSGEQMRQEGLSFVDGLIYGRRRWLFIDPVPFNALRESAREVLEAASAFMFFEQQLGELIEDFGMGKKGKKYFECNQEPGDLLFVPGSLVRVSLNLEDSISYFEHLHTSQQAAQEQIDSKLWAPASGRVPDGFNAAVCYGFDLQAASERLGGPAVQGMQAQLITQLMQQNFAPTPEYENVIVLRALAECYAAVGAPSVNAARTLCAKLWPQCHAKLAFNAKQAGRQLPAAAVLPPTLKVVDTGDDAVQAGAASSLVEEEDEAAPQKGKKAKKKKGKKAKKKKGKKEL